MREYDRVRGNQVAVKQEKGSKHCMRGEKTVRALGPFRPLSLWCSKAPKCIKKNPSNLIRNQAQFLILILIHRPFYKQLQERPAGKNTKSRTPEKGKVSSLLNLTQTLEPHSSWLTKTCCCKGSVKPVPIHSIRWYSPQSYFCLWSSADSWVVAPQEDM